VPFFQKQKPLSMKGAYEGDFSSFVKHKKAKQTIIYTFLKLGQTIILSAKITLGKKTFSRLISNFYPNAMFSYLYVKSNF
jgi:hypothetical protein